MKGPEAIIETDCSNYAVGLGLLTLKLRLLGAVGWPDRIYFAPGGRILFVEYKAPGKKLRLNQLYIHDLLRRYGFHVYTIDDIKKGRELLKSFTERAGDFDIQKRQFPTKETLKRRKHPEAEPPSLRKQLTQEAESLGIEIECPKHTTGGGPCYCNKKTN